MANATYNSVAELLAAGIVKIAMKPPANFHDLGAVPAYTLPLLDHDYPAKTAAMWNAVYEAFMMPDRNAMVVGNPKDTALVLDVLRRDPKYVGGGAGAGWKEVVIPLLDETTPLARAMGAVNIIKKTADGRLTGGNTDGLGYVIGLEELLRKRGESLGAKKILILGAGGAASAIAFMLAEEGAELTILNRTESRAHDLAERINRRFERTVAVAGGRNRIADALPRQDVVISAIEADDPAVPLVTYSALGPLLPPSTPEANLAETAVMLERAKPSLVVSDVRYPTAASAMLRQASELGFTVLDGLPMVANQGIEALWWLYGEGLASQDRAKGEVAAIMRKVAGLS